MEYIVRMLKNTKQETYHPIIYRESPLPGMPDKIRRFRSLGHRTDGFNSRDEAVASIQTDIVDRISEDDSIEKDLEGDILWNGEEMPLDTIIR